MNFEILPDNSLEMLHTAVRNALNKDKSLVSEGKGTLHEAHSNSDWRAWSNSLEEEMIRRDMAFDAILW